MITELGCEGLRLSLLRQIPARVKPVAQRNIGAGLKPVGFMHRRQEGHAQPRGNREAPHRPPGVLDVSFVLSANKFSLNAGALRQHTAVLVVVVLCVTFGDDAKQIHHLTRVIGTRVSVGSQQTLAGPKQPRAVRLGAAE